MWRNNIYVENKDDKKYNDTRWYRSYYKCTFDWAYEEEFHCRDGLDGVQMAVTSPWRIDATTIRDFYIINNTDSIYSKIIPWNILKREKSHQKLK